MILNTDSTLITSFIDLHIHLDLAKLLLKTVPMLKTLAYESVDLSGFLSDSG